MSSTTTMLSEDSSCAISKQSRIDDEDNYSTSDDLRRNIFIIALTNVITRK